MVRLVSPLVCYLQAENLGAIRSHGKCYESGANLLGRAQKLGNEVKGMVFQIFTMSRTTLSAVERIEGRLPSRSEQLLIRTFVLEDVLGRITQIDMDYVNSWDAFDGMLAVCFLGLPGHKKVAKKDYVIQDQKTSKELQRSIPWSGAFLPVRIGGEITSSFGPRLVPQNIVPFLLEHFVSSNY